MKTIPAVLARLRLHIFIRNLDYDHNRVVCQVSRPKQFPLDQRVLVFRICKIILNSKDASDLQ